MRTPARLALFGLAVITVFATAFGLARFAVPTQVAAPPAPTTSTMAGHDDGGHDDAGHDDGGHDHGDGEDHGPAGLAAEESGYRLTSLSAPTAIGVDGSLSFTLVGPDGSPVTDYTVSHDKELHLIVVRSDGAGFRHVHPTRTGPGVWSIDWRWDIAGSHRVYADFVPADHGEQLTLTSTVEVAGDYTPAAPTADRMRTEIDGLAVEATGQLRAGETSVLEFTVTRDGAPVTTIQPYLGAYGHLVALRSGDLAYLHVHPQGAEPPDATTVSGPVVSFAAEAPTPGRYLLYLDVRIDDTVRSVPFVMTAVRP